MEHLIYTDATHTSVGYLHKFSLDLESGKDDDFVLVLPLQDFKTLSPGCLIFCENHTELGGMVEGYNIDTAAKTVTFTGYAWRGILRQKVVGSGLYYASTDTIGDIVATAISSAGLTALYSALPNPQAVGTVGTLPAWSTVYDALSEFFSARGCIISARYNETLQKVEIGAAAIADYSSDEYDSDTTNMLINITRPVNHIIALSEDGGVYHRYLRYGGTIGTQQDYFGLDEIVATYETSKTGDERTAEMVEKLTEMVSASTVYSVSVSDLSADIGDKVGGRERQSGVFVTSHITSKILKMTENNFKIDFETGE